MPKAVSPAGSRSSPDLPLAGVRHRKGHRRAGNREDLPQAKLGNLRRCGWASAITAWAILILTASIPTPIPECARVWFLPIRLRSGLGRRSPRMARGFGYRPRLTGCASSGGGLHTITRRKAIQSLRMRRAIAQPHPEQWHLHNVDACFLVAAEDLDCLQLHKVLLGPGRIQGDRRK